MPRALRCAWQEQLAESLDRFAGELPAGCRSSAQEVYEEVTLLFVELAYAALLDERGAGHLAGISARLDSEAPEEAWVDLVDTLLRLPCDWLEQPAPAFHLLREHAFSAALVRHLLSWVRELGRQAQLEEDGVVRQLGALHEVLLGLRFEQLSSPARRLRKPRAWLEPSSVLGWPPEVRAKRLQRELGLSKHTVDAFGSELARAASVEQVEQCLSRLFDSRVEVRQAGRWVVQPGTHRRQSGAHYTPRALSGELVERTLRPVLAALPQPLSRSLLELRVCDPAMGAGAFLLTAARYLAGSLVEAWRAEAIARPGADEATLSDARRAVVCVLRGVDTNPMAVSLARLSLSLFLPSGAPSAALRASLRTGDALVGEVGEDVSASAPAFHVRQGAFNWRVAFPEVFERDNPGFDAVLGNPPWVAYVGRAAQPLEPGLAAYYVATNPAFKRYRTLHGLFVYRSATLLRRGGRLGLVLPTSVADLEGYSPTRAAHDALCDVDTQLPDWGDGAFDGVFQPSMALLSTRRAPEIRAPGSGIWQLQDGGLDSVQRGLLARLRRLPPFPRESFGERGFQSTQHDQAHLRRAAHAQAPFSVPLREGADIGEFRALEPQLFGDATRLGARLRPPSDWQKVALLIRQTARFPIAAFADGSGFRNSILAAFASPEWPAALLLCALNSSLLRWLHYTLHRDARQGMPQLKIGHLRALPALPHDLPQLREPLGRLGRQLGTSNAGIGAAERAELDGLVYDAFRLNGAEREAVAAWASAHPPPVSKRQLALSAQATVHRPADLPARGL